MQRKETVTYHIDKDPRTDVDHAINKTLDYLCRVPTMRIGDFSHRVIVPSSLELTVQLEYRDSSGYVPSEDVLTVGANETIKITCINRHRRQ